MSGPLQSASPRARNAQLCKSERWEIYVLAGIGAIIAGLTIAAPFAFKSFGDNGFIALAVPSGLLVIAATAVAERIPTTRALWLIIALAVALRMVALSFEPLLSTDVYRYIWDGKVQAAGINPYRYVPADPALADLRDPAIFPNINRADYAVTIYPPVAEAFFLLVTRFGANTIVIRIALLACEAVGVAVMLLLLRRLQRPTSRIVAYLWHPLPVWEIANSGHVDALMVCLLLVGMWLAFTGRAIRGAAVVALAALVKPFAAPALAAFWRPWNWKMVFIVVATVALCYVPYLSVGWSVFGYATGYLDEEGVASGDALWLLSIWRLAFGARHGDVAIYLALTGLAMALLALHIWRRPARTLASDLVDVNVLMLAALLLLSPNYPWYFLAVVPFAAILGNAPTWAASIGALLLTNEIQWDFQVPTMIVKSVLFGTVLLTGLWAMLAKHLRQPTPDERAQ